MVFKWLKNSHSRMLRASPAESTNFYTVWKINSDFYFYLTTFSNTLSNKLFISLFISFKYYLFIHYLLLFLITTHLPTFFYLTSNYFNRKKRIWRMNISSSDLMSYSSWANKKKLILERLLEHSFLLFSCFTFYILAMLLCWRCSKRHSRSLDNMCTNNYLRMFLNMLM